MDKKTIDTLFSVALVLLTVPLLGIALALVTINPLLILTAYAAILSFGMACAGLNRLERLATS
ncbi:MAG: hypothetical protein L6243_01615 [Candidatus Altiarchaeales archaeon]|nr:hypothetical protein [Candidatus Altiarchaeota archaeon]MCG2782268.1 hypothetical protein [Candidatus Altiarchaeales archaeon]